MKKIIMLSLSLIVFGAALAQQLRKTEKINSEQVPVAIRTAFEDDFGKIPDDGYWTANFIVEREGSRTVARPLSYTYHKRDKQEKIEVRYTADGKLDLVKGLEKSNSNS